MEGRQAEAIYTQVNILFQATEVELPPAEKFNGFPEEAQKMILLAFRTEQQQRHNWLRQQQANDQALNMQNSKFYFFWRIFGLGCATLLAIVFLLTGAWLVLNGASAVGVAMLVSAIAGLVGTAIYGHRALSAEGTRPSETVTPQS